MEASIETNPADPQRLKRPLFVDMDGTLVRNDTLLEGLLEYLKHNPLRVCLVLIWVLRGKNFFKNAISIRQRLEPGQLAYNPDFFTYLTKEKASGRQLILVTGAPQVYAQSVGEHFGIFSEIHGSTDLFDLTGTRKLTYIRKLIGAETPFDYAGNSWVDLAVWKGADSAIVVNSAPSLVQRAGKISTVSETFDLKDQSLRKLMKAMRLHQWAKNLLIFVPLITAHRLFEFQAFITLLLCFLGFGLCASGVYMVNDLWDIKHDRAHPSKKLRPFASGELSLFAGFVGAPVLILGGLFFASVVSVSCVLMLVSYVLISLIYSFRWKELIVIDVLVLSLLYNWRILTGAGAVDIELSPWLIGFMGFLFYSLALAKRATELKMLEKLNLKKSGGRGYQVEDLLPVSMIGCGSGIVAVLILALYINSYRVQLYYPNSFFLWPLCVVCLYWISRVWLITIRGQMDQDPVAFALKDPASYGVGFLSLLLYLMSAYELW